MKNTRVLLVENDPLVRPTVGLALQSLGYTIVGTAADRGETLRLLNALAPDLVVISPGVLEKAGMEFVREVLARERTSVLVIPGHPSALFARSLSLLRPADLGRLMALIPVVQALFGRRHLVSMYGSQE